MFFWRRTAAPITAVRSALLIGLSCSLVFLSLTGCGTTTKRIATEQLLMSDAVDNAIAKIDFQHLSGQDVYLDISYIQSIPSAGLVNSPYVISALRQQLTSAGCRIHDTPEDAEIIVEPRIGTLGADGHEVTFGIPPTGGISAAASVLAGSPIGAFPEISFAQSKVQAGVAKLSVFAYQRESRDPVWQSGIALAESNSSSTWILGAGPIQRGSIYEQPRFAGQKIEQVGRSKLLAQDEVESSVEHHSDDPSDEGVTFRMPHLFAAGRQLEDKPRFAKLKFSDNEATR